MFAALLCLYHPDPDVLLEKIGRALRRSREQVTGYAVPLLTAIGLWVLESLRVRLGRLPHTRENGLQVVMMLGASCVGGRVLGQVLCKTHKGTWKGKQQSLRLCMD